MKLHLPLLLLSILTGSILINAGRSPAEESTSRQALEAEKAGDGPRHAPNSLAPVSPYKEYIYLGGRLLVTEEGSAPVLPPPTDLGASACFGAEIHVVWRDNSEQETGFILERRREGESSYVLAASLPGNATHYLDRGVAVASNYTYRVKAKGAEGESAYSTDAAVATAAAPSFTDAVLAGILVKASHINELRRAVNIVRGCAGLKAFSWTETQLTPRTTTIKAVHIQQLRDQLKPALTALGLGIPSFTEDPLIARSTVIRRVHVDELRQAVQ